MNCLLLILNWTILELCTIVTRKNLRTEKNTIVRMVLIRQLFAILIVFMLAFIAAKVNGEDESIIITGKAVVFFGPTQAEYDVLSEDADSEIDEILFDFYYYVENLITSLDEADLQYFVIDHAEIQIELMDGSRVTLDKSEFGSEVGMILTDGERVPTVVIRLGTDVDMWFIIEEFFVHKSTFN